MARRLDFQRKLCQVLGSKNVYFQPPATIKMQYPCIVYSRSTIQSNKADDKHYFGLTRYTVTYIDTNPDSEMPYDLIKAFEYASYDRYYSADNLHHNVVTIYY